MKIHVAHILVSQRYEADDVLRKLQEGTEFGDLALRFSTCPSSANGGDLGLLEAGRLDDDFADAAQALKLGETSGVVKTRFGHHIIRRLA